MTRDPSNPSGEAAHESGAWIDRAARSKPLLSLLLGVVLAAGMLARTWECREGLPYQHHRDEQAIASLALNILKTGDWNPHFFNYGSLPIYLTVLVDAAHYLSLCGLPSDDPAAIPSLADLETHHDTGYKWTFSHPSFLFWNRFLTAVFGTGTLVLTWLLGRELSGRWSALAAVVFLAGLGFHTEYSTQIAPDVPAAFFALLAVLASAVFMRTRAPGMLVFALVAGGLTAATKYNLALVLLVPLCALAFGHRGGPAGGRGRLWLAALLVPPAAFLLAMPYALLDFSAFVEDLGREVYHYRVIGSTDHIVAPGFAAALRQLELFREHASLPVLLVALAGLPAMLRGRAARYALLFPLVYFLFMTRMKIDFHRNFVVVYPFVAIAFGCGVALIVRAVRARAPGAAATGLVAALALGGTVHMGRALREAYLVWSVPETRSRSIDAVNRLAREHGWTRVVLARELRVHPDDRERLEVEHFELPLHMIAVTKEEFDAVVTPYAFVAAPNALEESLRRAHDLNQQIPSGRTLAEIEGEPQILGLVASNPGVRIVAPGE